MGRMYSAAFTDVAITAAQDLFEINAPADAVVAIHSIHFGQRTDYGDTQAEGASILIQRATVSGSGGTTPTPAPHQVGDPAFGGTVEANNTTLATTLTLIQSYAFNLQAGFYYQFTPEERIYISPSGRVVISLPNAPADSITSHGTVVFEEIGG